MTNTPNNVKIDKILNNLQETESKKNLAKQNEMERQAKEQALQKEAGDLYSHAKEVGKLLAKVKTYEKLIKSTTEELKYNKDNIKYSHTKLKKIQAQYDKVVKHLAEQVKSSDAKLPVDTSLWATISNWFSSSEDKNRDVYYKMLEMQKQEAVTLAADQKQYQGLKDLAAYIKYYSPKSEGEINKLLAQAENIESIGGYIGDVAQELDKGNWVVEQVSNGNCLPFFTVSFGGTPCYSPHGSFEKLGLETKFYNFFSNYSPDKEYLALINKISELTKGNKDKVRSEVNKLKDLSADLYSVKDYGQYDHVQYGIDVIYNDLLSQSNKKAELEALLNKAIQNVSSAKVLSNMDLVASINEAADISAQQSKYLEELSMGMSKLACYANGYDRFSDVNELKNAIEKCEKEFSQPTMFDDAILHNIQLAFVASGEF